MDLSETTSRLTLSDSNEDQNKMDTKREDYLSWEDYFMGIAFLAAKRSKDPVTQVGACIVSPEKKILGIGYNGMPIGCHDDKFPWCKNQKDVMKNKHLFVCHAEMNAILNNFGAELRGCTMYVSLFPCNECAKLIVQSGIRRVVFVLDKHAQNKETVAAKLMFDTVGIQYSQYKPEKTIIIDFADIKKN